MSKDDLLSSQPVFQALDSMQHGILILGVDLKVQFVNSWISENAGVGLADVQGKHFKDVFPTANDKGLNRKVRSALVVNGPVFCSGANIGYLLQIPLKRVTDANCKFMQQDWAVAPFDANHVIISIYDMTTAREAESRINQAYDDLSQLKQSLEQKVALMDRYIPSVSLNNVGKIVHASEAFSRLCRTDNALEGKELNEFFKISEVEQGNITAVLSGKHSSWEGKLTTSSIDDKAYWVEVNLIREQQSSESETTAIFRDITNEKYYEELSSVDMLTGGYNRQFFEQALAGQVSSAQRYETFFSVVLVDIDHFKSINDTHGHLVGDEVLIELSALVRNSIRGCDIFARWGGEEFVILLPQTDLRDGLVMAQKCCEIIANHPFKSVGRVTASFGVAEYSSGEGNDLLKHADHALYEAKKSGRNCVKYWQK